MKCKSVSLNFCPVLAEMVESNAAVGKDGKVIHGLGPISTINNLCILRNLQLELQPQRTLEIGMAFGGSTLVLTSTHRDLGQMPKKQHTALDPFQTSVWAGAGILAVERAALSGFLDFRARLSSQELPTILDNKEQIDLVYVDGSHLFEDVFVDFYFVGRLLSQKGVVLFDDSSLPHVQKVLRFIRNSLRASFVELDLAKYRPDGGKALRYRVARMLGKQQLTAFRRVGSPTRAWDAPFINF